MSTIQNNTMTNLPTAIPTSSLNESSSSQIKVRAQQTKCFQPMPDATTEKPNYDQNSLIEGLGRVLRLVGSIMERMMNFMQNMKTPSTSPIDASSGPSTSITGEPSGTPNQVDGQVVSDTGNTKQSEPQNTLESLFGSILGRASSLVSTTLGRLTGLLGNDKSNESITGSEPTSGSKSFFSNLVENGKGISSLFGSLFNSDKAASSGVGSAISGITKGVGGIFSKIFNFF